MTDDQRAMYAAVAVIRNNEVTLRWTRAQLFFVIHSAGLSFVVTQFAFGSWLYTFACVVGAWLGALWWGTTVRIGHWVGYWNGRLAALERAEPVQPVRIFGGREYETARRGWTTHVILLFLVGTFIALWIGLGIASHGRYLGRW